MWEAVFMLVLLKIPVVYLGVVVWLAIRAVPADEVPPAAVTVPVADTPPPSPSGWTRGYGDARRSGPRRRPPSTRSRRAPAAVR